LRAWAASGAKLTACRPALQALHHHRLTLPQKTKPRSKFAPDLILLGSWSLRRSQGGSGKGKKIWGDRELDLDKIPLLFIVVDNYSFYMRYIDR
jgi:hypothetical protein